LARKLKNRIQIIDLFAGPGGLGEGFASYSDGVSNPFQIAISIEKEASAHSTLELRALFRRLRKNDELAPYYAFLRGELGRQPKDGLYLLPELEEYLNETRQETLKLELGQDRRETFKHVRKNLKKDVPTVLIGGPPCQAYSLVGRSRNYGDKTRDYRPEDDHRNFLYKEYLAILAKFQPEVFVMENVKGILSANVGKGGIFTQILADLAEPHKAVSGTKKCRYKIIPLVSDPKNDLFDTNHSPRDYIIQAERFGVPQARHRVILLGIREDILGKEVGSLRPSPTTDTKSTISDLPGIRSKLSKEPDSLKNWRNAIGKIDLRDVKSYSGSEISDSLRDTIAEINLTELDVFGKVSGSNSHDIPKNLSDWLIDPEMGSLVVNHESRGHIVGDLHRYLFASVYAQHEKRSAKAGDFPPSLIPQHKNFNSGKFVDRFKVQREEVPASTITSHISKDGHYYIHYDPRQCRSLTVREAARIQTFPDNYFFVGNRTQQYLQVGNAVPPYLARQIADIVAGILK